MEQLLQLQLPIYQLLQSYGVQYDSRRVRRTRCNDCTEWGSSSYASGGSGLRFGAEKEKEGEHAVLNSSVVD